MWTFTVDTSQRGSQKKTSWWVCETWQRPNSRGKKAGQKQRCMSLKTALCHDEKCDSWLRSNVKSVFMKGEKKNKTTVGNCRRQSCTHTCHRELHLLFPVPWALTGTEISKAPAYLHDIMKICSDRYKPGKRLLTHAAKNCFPYYEKSLLEK